MQVGSCFGYISDGRDVLDSRDIDQLGFYFCHHFGDCFAVIHVG